ncbi:MAG: NrtA/SsuA/CpmA family ABC transporter substrate-binding protein [Burkholderiales bacterium]|nr:NrtA/SsuA/CpmA family ABC transporter substrate-binding protein [Burkholderiales bacterium]
MKTYLNLMGLIRTTFIFLLFVFAGAAPPVLAQGGGGTPIRIAWQPDPNVAFYLARDKNLFEKAGLQPEYVKFLAAPPMFAALQSGSVDVADIGLPAAVIAKSQGIDIKIIMVAVDVSGTNVLVAQKGQTIRSGKDLRGKRIGATKGSGTWYGLVRYLERDGLSMQDVQFLDLSAPNIVPAFRRGEVDAAWTWSPWQNLLVEMGGKPIASNKDIGALAPQVWVVRAEWARQNPEALQRFMKGIDSAFQLIGANRDLAAKAMSEMLNVDNKVASDTLRASDHPDLKTQASVNYPLSVVAGYPGATAGLSLAAKNVAKFLHSQGIIKATVAADDVVDPGPLKRYLHLK